MLSYIILFFLAGIIELLFMGLGMGTSAFSILAALVITYLSSKILKHRFVNGRVLRLALIFSVLHLALGNIPIALATPAERLKPVSIALGDHFLSFLSAIFRGPLDQYQYFWLAQSFIFTLVFLGVFMVFSNLLRRADNGFPAGTLQDQNS